MVRMLFLFSAILLQHSIAEEYYRNDYPDEEGDSGDDSPWDTGSGKAHDLTSWLHVCALNLPQTSSTRDQKTRTTISRLELARPCHLQPSSLSKRPGSVLDVYTGI